MGLTRKGVESLWNSPERQEKAHEIVRRLLARDAQGAQQLLDKVDGRWDLRGFDLSLREGDTPFQGYTPTGMEWPKNDRNHYHDLVLENFDFTSSLFSSSVWEDCVFRDCLFVRSDLFMARFVGCTFERVKFHDCWIENFLFGGGNENNLGKFIDVEFVRGRFSRVTFSFPSFERCRFKCKVSHVNFHGSQFADCSFEDVLSEVTFWKSVETNPGEEYMLGRPVPINPMRNVDFSKAKFKEVGFIREIDLRECRFPKDVVFVSDIHAVFPEVIRRIEAEWSSPDKEKGIEEATSYMINKRDYPIGQVVLNPYLEERRLGKEFADMFLDLVRGMVDNIPNKGPLLERV